MKLSDWLQASRGRAIELSRSLGVSQSIVSDWLAGKKQVPLERCPYIERFTGGAVTCEELRPDQADYFALLRARAGGPDSAPARIEAKAA